MTTPDTTIPAQPSDAETGTAPPSKLLVFGAWLLVGVPLGYGISQTLIKAAKLFTG